MATKIEDWMCGELEKLGIPASYENAELVNGLNTLITFLEIWAINDFLAEFQSKVWNMFSMAVLMIVQ
jgi:hypothetical protein